MMDRNLAGSAENFDLSMGRLVVLKLFCFFSPNQFYSASGEGSLRYPLAEHISAAGDIPYSNTDCVYGEIKLFWLVIMYGLPLTLFFSCFIVELR